ncbi:MAG: hypothetical protein QF530_12700, partial [SAR202 cluster bacterium]|nr:hypothetical protein [SAR202 cluster bacterium]
LLPYMRWGKSWRWKVSACCTDWQIPLRYEDLKGRDADSGVISALAANPRIGEMKPQPGQ